MEQAIRDRLRHIHSLRITGVYSKWQTLQIHQREMNVSQATAYRDYNWAMQLFGDLDKVDLAAERMILREAYWRLYQKALEEGDLEQERKALDSYKSLFDFAGGDQQVDVEKIAAHQYHIKLSRGGYKLLRSALRSGVVDLNEVGEETEYETIEET